jgi:hypothetical protein
MSGLCAEAWSRLQWQNRIAIVLPKMPQVEQDDALCDAAEAHPFNPAFATMILAPGSRNAIVLY